MKKNIIMSLVLILATVCCVSALSARRSTDTSPEWLANPQARYPQQMYITAIGEGDNRSRAEANAASNLARIFEVEVETTELFTERYQEIVSEEDFSATTETDIDRSVALTASQKLYNIQFADSHTDNLGKVYVLAYIDRHKTGDIYVEMINDHAARITGLISRAEHADSSLQKYAFLSKASVLSSANELLLSQLQIIAPDYRNFIELGYRHQDLVIQTRESAQNLNFNIDVANDNAGKIHSVIADMLTGIGFTLTENGEILVNGEITLETVDLGRKESFVRWHLTLNMFDAGGNIVVTHAQRGREGHINESEAVARAFMIMEKEVRNEFKVKLFSYFDNLVE
jgi:hypothetical protein